MVDLDELQKKLKAIADTVNSFKSEAVQLRVVDVLLGQLDATDAAPPGSPRTSQKTNRKSRRRREKAAPAASGEKIKRASKSSRGSGSPGAFAAINELLGTGFFNAPRTISSVVDHCRTERGHHYKANECSPAILRLLRDTKLKRQKNKDGQYEYIQ